MDETKDVPIVDLVRLKFTMYSYITKGNKGAINAKEFKKNGVKNMTSCVI